MKMPRTINIPNGDTIAHTFSDAEYQNRQRKLRAHMAQKNIGTILKTKITKQKNNNILSILVRYLFGTNKTKKQLQQKSGKGNTF